MNFDKWERNLFSLFICLFNFIYENLFNLNILLYRGDEIILDFFSNGEWIECYLSYKLFFNGYLYVVKYFEFFKLLEVFLNIIYYRIIVLY